MNFKDKICNFSDNIGTNTLFLVIFPSLCALGCAKNTFKFNFQNGMLAILSIIFFFYSVKIFDDFIDFILSNPDKRKEIEQMGIRGLYTKSFHFAENPKLVRTYFYLSLLFFILAGSILAFLCMKINNFRPFFAILILPVFGLLNYLPFFNKIIDKTGTELLSAILCVPVSMLVTFYISARCISTQVLMLCLILFFFVYNLFFIQSTLNMKEDSYTNKTTLAKKIKSGNLTIAILFFLAIIPYLLTAAEIWFNVLPKLSALTFVLIFNTLWQFYLMYLFIKKPHINIKWHFLMGEDSNKITHEQLNQSWYTVRYNFARNIFVTYSLIICLII